MSETVSAIMMSLLVLATLALVFSIQPVRASGTIYINSDGIVTPSTAPISTVNGITYVLTGNVNDSVIVQKGNIVLDGFGYIIQGPGSGFGDNGVFLSFVGNVTIRNVEVTGFGCGIYLTSSNNTVSNSNVTGNGVGIGLEVSYNILSGNSITGNGVGISSNSSFSNTVSGNNINENGDGLVLAYCSGNVFYYNNFINNTRQAKLYGSSPNSWDDGYPSGGNYWSDYAGVDLYSGIYQNATGIDGVGDTPYVIDVNNTDRYPLMRPFDPETEDLTVSIRNLLLEYNSLQSDFESLNSTYDSLLTSYASLQTNYSNLQANLAALNSSYLGLKTDYDALNASYNSLNASSRDYQQTTQNELANVKNALYAFIAITAILAVVSVYVATRKRKTKPQT